MKDRKTDAAFVWESAPGRFSLNWRLVRAESIFVTARLVREIVKLRDHATGLILDIGCGSKPYRCVFEGRVSGHVGIDVPTSLHPQGAVDAYSTALTLPFRAQSFDFVLCTEVLEHVSDPFAAMQEIGRVLKHGAKALVTTPFMYRVHEVPIDFFRYTAFAHRALAARAGLEIVLITTRGGY